MSAAPLPKDARGIFQSAGKAALLEALEAEDFPEDAPPPEPQPQAEGTAGPQPFTIARASEIKGRTEAADFVEGLLTEAGASVVYGPSNCGKSFWALDLAACVATGTAFRDELEVDHGAVVYVALEGTQGARNRIEALRQAGQQKTRICLPYTLQAYSQPT